MFTEKTAEEIKEVASEFGIEPAAMLAVVEVESAGSDFAVIEGRQEPLIRFEGHYFDRRLSGDALARARADGLASPNAGAVANPASQAARWRLLARAAEIDRKAAYESVSWGLGQVMGAHWAWLGFADVDALVDEARTGAAGQARLMARFIEKSGLTEALRNRDWEAFARGYNGPGFRKNAYHTKLAAAYRRHAAGASGGTGDDRAGPSAPRALLAEGSAGDAVRDLQQQLAALGYPLTVDGIFGKDTEEAVRAFQRDHGLGPDGIVGPKTLAAIGDAMPFGGWWHALGQRVLRWFGRE
ncbi:N-acetylmuramidase domain-containing protein [Mesorhizobium sp. KR9-304]|uniref:N-acetylmuramidase domain-containing protein n=1 Tax=Mesorhizobium sp. KR9-304 TaxID=3156614 RepID=UPI0032B59279